MPVNVRLEPTRCWIAQVHHILASGQECYNLGPDYYERRDTDRATAISEQQGDRRMSYLDDARAGAKRRKSPWNLLLIPAVLGPWLLLSWVSAVELGKLHRLLHPGREFVVLPEGVSGILMAVAPLLAWLAPAMVVGNLLVAAIGPAKRALDVEARAVRGTDLLSSTRSLLRLSLVLTPTALLVAFIGACTAW